jgi:hypothetical protein
MLNPIQKEFHADPEIEAREDNYPPQSKVSSCTTQFE